MLNSVSLIILAGMPSITLSSSAAERFNAISFFLLVLLLSTLIIRFCWGQLSDVTPQIPKATFRQAFAVSILLGLCSIVVLTMISGARELMTPGAWQKNGLTYQVGQTETGNNTEITLADYKLEIMSQRELKITELKNQLLIYSARHDGQYPASKDESWFVESLWQLPETLGGTYILRSGHQFSNAPIPLVIEPEIDGSQWAILANGSVQNFKPDALKELLDATSE
ncbi:hypothetical protein [uncultured Rubinisphaera sp.]|uniref:hypothetical protein n=1 Tax=uncultured Rubinisphaera sp. TaxID=1678686 RepID=UPI0030D96C68|tara:strand:- start:128 stop:805 length:678 start_codon:yes stop_codon:yes gene_type:complete